MTLTIVGAGLAGLLAANLLRHREPMVCEAQSELPNNHSAVLRFRSSVVGDVLGIPFRQVSMIKAAAPWLNPVADALAYAKKGAGEYRSDRSIVAGTVSEDRFIAPPDLIPRAAARLPADTLRFDCEFNFASWSKHGNLGGPVISTVPMPALMKALGYLDKPQFNYVRGFNVRARVKFCDAYVSLLIPNPSKKIARISLTGDELIAECPGQHLSNVDSHSVAREAALLLGIETHLLYDVDGSEQTYAKISPIDNDARKAFIYWATTERGVYSLGRYATWRPGLLLDDLVQDVRLIDKWLSQGGEYDRARRK